MQHPPLSPEETKELAGLEQNCPCDKAKPGAAEKKHKARGARPYWHQFMNNGDWDEEPPRSWSAARGSHSPHGL